jgi:hypothetical protein
MTLSGLRPEEFPDDGRPCLCLHLPQLPDLGRPDRVPDVGLPYGYQFVNEFIQLRFKWAALEAPPDALFSGVEAVANRFYAFTVLALLVGIALAEFVR